MITIETAVMPLAGAGTRVFPGTTAIEKCMMPIYEGNAARPVVDYMVEDCARAGIKRVIFVTSERGRTQLQDYFEQLSDRLEEQLRRTGKDVKIAEELERRRSYDMRYDYVIQPTDTYGTAYPPFLAMPLLAGESHFTLAGGDDFVYHPDGTSELRQAIETLNMSSNNNHVIMGNPVPREDAPKYGVLQTSDDGVLLGIDEKPPIDRVPENPIVNISRYVLSDKIWPHIQEEMSRSLLHGEEHYITNPITNAATEGQVFRVHAITGTYLDGGSPQGLLQASQYITEHPRTT